MGSLYYLILALLLMLLCGVLFYAWRRGRHPKETAGHDSEERSGSTPSAPDKVEEIAGPTEHLVEVVDLHGEYLQTRGGKLVALLQMDPVLLTNGLSPEVMDNAYAEVIHALPSGLDLQVVSMPVPPQLAEFTERYARAAHAWRNAYEQRAAAGDLAGADAARNRYRAAAGIGAMILDEGSAANYRATLITLTTDIRPLGEGEHRVDPVQMGEFEADVSQVATIFREFNFTVRLLPPHLSLRYLWYAYNPDSNSEHVADQTSSRYLDIAQFGSSAVPATTGLTDGQIDRAVARPRQELVKLLAPAVVEEDDCRLHFHGKTMLLYFVVDYRHKLPRIEDLQGRSREYANTLFLTYFLHFPPPEEVAQMTDRAGTGLRTLETLRSKWSDKRDYGRESQYAAIEEARAGAQTRYAVMRNVGMYVGVLVDTEDLKEEVPRFEAVLRAAGLTFVPAHWNAMDVWRTMHPLGQRLHHFEDSDRNVYSENVGQLNPLSAATLFDPRGEFLGFSLLNSATMAPVAVQRKRGTRIVASDALVGAPGSGKSYALKQWITDWTVRGHRVIALDPKTELGPVARVLGGAAVDALGSEGFNIFHFDRLPVDADSKLGRALQEMVLLDNLDALTTLYLSAKGEQARLDGEERNLLMNALTMAMQQKGMDPNDPQTWEANGVMLADVYEVLTRQLMQENLAVVGHMKAILEPYALKGGLFYRKYNTPVAMDLDADLVTMTFGLAQLVSDRTMAALAYHFALRLTMQHALRSFILSREERPRPFHIVIDEASQLLVMPSLVSTVVRMLSILPAYDIYVHLAFQDFKAIVRSDELSRGHSGASNNTLLGTIPAFWLFGQQHESAVTACEKLNLPGGVASQITGMHVGQCLLVFPQAEIRLPVTIRSPQEMQGLYETDAGAMKAMLHEAMSTRGAA